MEAAQLVTTTLSLLPEVHLRIKDGSRRIGIMQMMPRMMMESMGMDAHNIIKIPVWSSSILYNENSKMKLARLPKLLK